MLFGGDSNEHLESIRAIKLFVRLAAARLFEKYTFLFFYLSRKNKWATEQDSADIANGRIHPSYHDIEYDLNRMLDLKHVDMVYSACMGPTGESGDIMGLARLMAKPMIGCDILASALCLDKRLAKIVAQTAGSNIVDYICVHRKDPPVEVAQKVGLKIGYPCFLKPTNLGTCGFVFKIDNEQELIQKYTKACLQNLRSDEYLIEKYIDNVEVRLFCFEDLQGKLHTNDSYVTKLNLKFFKQGGDLFKQPENTLSSELRSNLQQTAKKLFRLFGMKDYARIDFFIEQGTQKVYFNEANTQPMLVFDGVTHLGECGLRYDEFFEMMIKRNMTALMKK